MIGRAAAIYTDAFIMLSGLLTTYSIIGRLQKNQSPRIVQEYFSRFLRIVPMLAALVLFCTFVLPELGSGPQWNLVVNRHAEICKENWWRNFLFIHNYFGFGEMVRQPVNKARLSFSYDRLWFFVCSVSLTHIIWASIRNYLYFRQ